MNSNNDSPPERPVKVPKSSPLNAPRQPSQPMDLQQAPRAKQPYLSRESVRNIETLALRKVRHALVMRGFDANDLI